jgi:predicted acetyltransferase
LLDIVEEPEAVTCQVETGPMIRLCDVRTALSRLSFPDGIDERVALAVTDSVAPWNDLTVALRVAPDISDCARTKLPPDASVGIRTLSQLAIGYYDVETARTVGDLDCDDETATALSRLFPPERVCLREFF